MKKINWFVVSGIFILAGALSALAAETVPVAKPVELTCESLVNPLGIDTPKPRLSWKIDAPGVQGTRQLAYQVQVASSEALLSQNKADLWDSGKVESDQSLHVAYSGKELTSRMACYWRVRVWIAAGKGEGVISKWSKPASWSMGLLKSSDWGGKWIGVEKGEVVDPIWHAKWVWFPEGQPAKEAAVGDCYFRRVWELPSSDGVGKTTCRIAADDTFVLWVNGQEVGRGGAQVSSTFDISQWLRAGPNVIAIKATNLERPRKSAGLVAAFSVDSKSDPVPVMITDAKWRVSRQESTGWKEKGFDDAAWQSVVEISPFYNAPWGWLDTNRRVLAGRLLRREFSTTRQVARATAYMSGLGFSELYINGAKISDDVHSPALSNYRKRAFYVTYDVTKQVHQGANAMGVMLGNGRYFSMRRSDHFGYPRLMFQLVLDYADGSSESIVSDETWKITDQGPIIENNEYDGETYDARREQKGWNLPGFEDNNWIPVQVLSPLSPLLQSQMMEPMRITKRLKPVSVTPSPKPGAWIVDFGQNFYGNVKIRVRGKKGDQVSMVAAYSLGPDGNLLTAPNRTAKCTDIYILKGEGEEEWSPAFVGRGFRRIEVSGFPGKPDASNFEGQFIHTDIEIKGSFECSNSILNKIHQNYLWTARSGLRSLPLDSDRDERQGWNGDTAKALEAQSYDLGVASLYSKWHDDHCYDQQPSGLVPCVVPVLSHWMQPDVLWPGTMLLIPETLHLYHGDTCVITRNFDAIKKFVDYGHGLKKDGVIPDAVFSDWCDVSSMSPVRRRGPQNGRCGRYECGATDGGLISTAYQYHHERILARFATVLGKQEEALLYKKQAETTKTVFNKRYLDPSTGIYLGATQTGQCVPLMFDMVPAENRDRVIAALVDDIMVARNGHLSVGLIGAQWLLQTLTKIGRPDVAYVVAAQTTQPSWGYAVTKGATTIWERWDTDTGDVSMNSEMLMMLAGNFNGWLYQTLAGINPAPEAPGFKKILIMPQPVADLTWVKAHHESPYGRIESNWTLKGDRFKLDVVIPPNTTAKVVLPDGTEHAVESGKHTYSCVFKSFVPRPLDLKPSPEKTLEATDGYITTWQISGPYYQGEKAIRAVDLFDTVFRPETSDKNVAWLFYDARQTEGPRTLHLGKVFDGFEHVTYLKTVLRSSLERTVILEINTPDRVKVWVRGAPVVLKTNEAGKQTFEVALVAGDNPLLVKTVQMRLDLEVTVCVRPYGAADLKGLSASADEAGRVRK